MTKIREKEILKENYEESRKCSYTLCLSFVICFAKNRYIYIEYQNYLTTYVITILGGLPVATYNV